MEGPGPKRDFFEELFEEEYKNDTVELVMKEREEMRRKIKDMEKKIEDLGREIDKYPKDSIAFTFTDPWDLVYADKTLLKLQCDQDFCIRYIGTLKEILPHFEKRLQRGRERQAD